MANPDRGEVDLDVNGTRYRLALGMGGLRAIQTAVSTPGKRVTLLQVVQGAEQGDVEYLAVLIWGALQRYHPEVTLDGVDAMLDALGGIHALPIVLGKIADLMRATGPDARDAAVLKKTETAPESHPSPAPIGSTGTGSTSKRERSA